jgi:hypothetical protein
MTADKPMHLARANAGIMRGASYDDPVMAGFVARLDPLNEETRSRFDLLWTSGPSREAFTFSTRFTPGGTA